MAPRKVKYVQELSVETVKCRALYHGGDIVVSYVSRIGKDTVYDTHLVCRVCGGHRYDLTVKGEGLIARRYDLPAGYTLPKGVKVTEVYGDRWTFTAMVKDDLYRRLSKPAPEEVKAQMQRRLS